jgi:protoporphyrinogen oxidase
MPNSLKIAVLGAGPMGLAVAYQLVREGKQPVIYEADDRVGGMTACFDFNGLQIERFYHFNCISDDAYFEILRELGLMDRLHWVSTKMGYWFKGEVQAWGNPIALLRFRGLGLVAKFRYGLHAFLCTKRNDWRPLDKIEATAWIKDWVGAEAWEILWKRLFYFKFYHESESLSAAWIWSRVRRI